MCIALCFSLWGIRKYKPCLVNKAETYKMNRDIYANNELNHRHQAVKGRGIWKKRECRYLGGVRELGLLLVLGLGPLRGLLVLGDIGWV